MDASSPRLAGLSTDRAPRRPATPRKGAGRRSVAPDVFLAFRDLVYLHGVEHLAPRMGLRPGTLYNKADGSDDTHNQPTLRDVLLATQMTGDMRVLDALDATFDRAAFHCGDMTSTSDEALLDLVTSLGAESGEFHAALGRALKDRDFTRKALHAIRGEAFDIVSALMTLLVRLEDYCDDDAQA